MKIFQINNFYTMLRDRTSIRIIVFVSLPLLFAFLVVLFVFNYLQTGKIIVSTKNKDTLITVNSTKENTKEILKEGRGRLSVRLEPGNYYIEVKNTNDTKTKYINIEKGDNLKIELDPIPINVSEPVIAEGATSIAADDSNLLFLTNYDLIKSIDAGNNVDTLSLKEYKKVMWVNVNYGIALDNKNSLYVVQNNTLSRLAIPEDIKNTEYDFTLSPSKTLYIWTKKSIYQVSGQDYTNIFNLEDKAKRIESVIASNSSIVVVSGEDEYANSQPYAENHNHEGIEEYEDRMVIILANKNVTAQKVMKFDDIAISTDGSNIAISSIYGTYIYDSNLNLLSTLVNSNVKNLLWLNNDSLIYNIQDRIISYNTKTRESYTITKSPFAKDIEYISSSDNRLMLYYSSKNQKNELVMSRASVSTSYKVSSDSIQLQYILPVSFNDCSAQLINFTKTTIELIMFSEEIEPNCKFKTIEYLQEHGQNYNNLNFSTLILNEEHDHSH